MMNVRMQLIQRYAQAYSAVFAHELSMSQIQSLEILGIALADKKEFLSLIEQHSQEVGELHKLPSSVVRLIDLLVQAKRISLLPAILQRIGLLYKKERGIEEFTITTALPLSDQEQSRIERFLAHKTGCAIMGNYIVDKNLIAGIRMQSDRWLWEHSVAQQLRLLEQVRI